MINMVIEVSGMSCEGCENRVKNILREWQEIKFVEAFYHKGIIKIITSTIIDEQLITEKIENLGFEVKRISYE